MALLVLHWCLLKTINSRRLKPIKTCILKTTWRMKGFREELLSKVNRPCNRLRENVWIQHLFGRGLVESDAWHMFTF